MLLGGSKLALRTLRPKASFWGSNCYKFRAMCSEATEKAAPKPKFQKIVVPRSGLDFKYVKSSGPGGQNVNKRSTKAELRFSIQKAEWLPKEVQVEFTRLHGNRINSEGEIIVSCQKYRTQSENEKSCLHLLQEFVDDACFAAAGLPTRDERRQSKIQRAKAKLRSRAIKKVKTATIQTEQSSPL
jgi:protein subunit release factor B